MIFHLALERDWQRALEHGSYEISTRGLTLAEVGFIHASFEHQVAPVATAFYGDVTEPLVVLVIEPEQLDSPLVVEEVADAGDPFPHIYGPLNPSAVVEVRRVAVTEAGFRFLDEPS